jgi:hypothetical protein
MIPKNTLKPNLSIDKIGVLRFWTGLAIGILFGFTLCLFFNYSREILRYLSGSFSDIIILDKNTSLFFNVFFASFSSAIGFSVTFWFWMSGNKNKYHKQRLFARLSQVNSTIIIWIPLMIITRIGSILFVLLYAQRGYDSNLKLVENFKVLFLIFPLVIFFQNWITIRNIFKVKKWILYSFTYYLVVSMITFLLASADTEIVDKNYSQRFQVEYEFIDNEVKRAKENYATKFEPSTIKTLKQWHTTSSKEQIKKIQNAFESKNAVSLDTIILQKIIVKNFKEGYWFHRKRNSFDNWPFAKPIDIQRQIDLNRTELNKLIELEGLLNEQIDLINYLGKNKGDFEQLSQIERRKIFGAKYRIPKVVVDQLIAVTNELNNNFEFENHKIKLKKINL